VANHRAVKKEMLLESVWRLCEEQLFEVPSQPGLFNPYHDRHESCDRRDAVAIRRANLRQYLACFNIQPRLFLLAEAPGPWGCRFSGVPITSETQLRDGTFPINGDASSLEETPHDEYSAKIFWRVLQPTFPHFFIWNSVPVHPHKPGQILSIRNPTNREVSVWGEFLASLLIRLRPERTLAIGRKAEYALRRIGREGEYVRHPSQGGAKVFESGVMTVLEEMGL